MANAKKPVEKNKKKNTTEKTTTKKVVKEEPMSNDMVQKDGDDKVWFVIVILLIILIGGAFVVSKFTKVEDKVETTISTKKSISENEDGTVEVTLKFKSNVGIKSVTLEDGTVLNYNDKKEIEIKFTADEDRKYKFVFKDVNGKEITKEINITGTNVKEEEPKEEILKVENNNETVTYYYQAPVQTPAVTTPVVKDEAVIEGITEGEIVNKDVVLTIKGNYNILEVEKDGVIDTTLTNTYTEEGKYVVRALKDEKELATVSFEIDKTAPLFYNGLDLVEEEINTVRVFTIEAEDNNEVTYLVKENEEIKVFENMIIREKGTYEVTATDVAGNATTITVNMHELFNMDLNQMIFNKNITIKYNELLEDTTSYVSTLEKYNKEEESYEEVEYAIGSELSESGIYRLTVNVDGEDIVATFCIDKEAPVVDVNVDVTEEGTNVEVTATDEGTGIKDVSYGFSNDNVEEPEEYKELEDSIELPEKEGEYYLWVEATDNAENKTTEVVEEAFTVEAPVATNAVENNLIDNEDATSKNETDVEDDTNTNEDTTKLVDDNAPTDAPSTTDEAPTEDKTV